MTKKHFQAIAEIIKWGIDEEENAKGCGIAVKMARRLADLCETENLLFNRARFIKACKPANLAFLEGTGQTEAEYFNI